MAYTTIDDPSAYFHTQLYTGDGNATQAITNDANAGDFKPDWLWIKNRSAEEHHMLANSNRGAGKRLRSDTDAAEDNNGVTSFNTDGFTTLSSAVWNANTHNYVAWQWKANGGTTSTNSDGTVDVTIQVNATAGFSIMTWTGNGNTSGTVGHGLGAIPDLIINKYGLTSTSNWSVAFPKFETSKLLALNNDAAFFTASGLSGYNSSVFTDGNGASTSGTLSYCFKNIQGYSQFGKYEGNSNTDGPFVYLGFKPAYLVLKRASGVNHWHLFDNKRDINNPVQKHHGADYNNSEGSNTWCDLLSNGFKLRTTLVGVNGDGDDYVYMAFAEHPFVSSEGVPTTAR